MPVATSTAGMINLFMNSSLWLVLSQVCQAVRQAEPTQPFERILPAHTAIHQAARRTWRSGRRRNRRRREPQRLRRVFLEHQVEFPVGEAVGPHSLGKGAHALQAAILLGSADLGPEFRKEAVLRPDLADRVHA